MLRLLLPLAALLIAGCTSTVGLFTAERTGNQTLQDVNATMAIKTRMSRTEGFYLKDVDVEITEGVALLTGEVPRPEDKIEAERASASNSMNE